jgi:hypothetical protein
MGFFIWWFKILVLYLYYQIDTMITHKYVTLTHPTHGKLVDETFLDQVQFKLFLKMIHSCLELKEDFSTFNGKDFLVHIPYQILRESIIVGNTVETTFTEVALMKSKIEG